MTTIASLNADLDNSANVGAVALPWPGFRYWGEYHLQKRAARAYNLVNRNIPPIYSAEEFDNFDRIGAGKNIFVPPTTPNFTVFGVFRVNQTLLAANLSAINVFDNLTAGSSNSGIRAQLRPKGTSNPTSDTVALNADGSMAAGTTTNIIVPSDVSDGFSKWNLLVWARQDRVTNARLLGLNRDARGTVATSFASISNPATISVGPRVSTEVPVDVAMFAHADRAFDEVTLRQIIRSIEKRMTKAGVSFGQAAG